MRKKFFLTLIFVLFIIFFINITKSKAYIEYNYCYSFDNCSKDAIIEQFSLPDDFNENTHYMVTWVLRGSTYPMIYYTNNENFSHFTTYFPEGYPSNAKFWAVDNEGNFLTDMYIRDGDTSNYTWGNSKIWGAIDTSNHVLFSTDPIYNSDGTQYYGDFGVTINYLDDNLYCEVDTNFFNMSEKDNLKCSISSDDVTYKEFLFGEDPVNNKFLFYCDVYKNGTYYIKLEHLDSGTINKLCITIDKINEGAHSLNLHLSTEEQTTEPIYILSNRYYYEGEYNAEDDWLLDYDIDVSYGLESPYEFSPFEISGYDEERQMNYKQYQYKIVINGIYKFQIIDLISGTISYQTFNVTNIGVLNKFGDDVYYNNYNENGEFDPTPVLFLEYVNTTTVRIRTQPFIFNELMYLECYFSSDGENYEKINNTYKYSVDSSNSSYDYYSGEKQNIIDTYYFYYDVNSDGIYYFKFYNIDLKKYTISSIEVNIQEFLINNIDNIDKYPDRMIIWANKHFGVLIYPVTFCVKLFGKINNINYSEPVLHIPELHEPIGNYKILDAIDFNFNSVIENAAAKKIYNIYLVAVDFVLIILFVVLCKNVFSEVFSK